MPAYVYANGQYHALAGNKIAKDGALLTMADTDRIVVGGVAYPLGAATGASQTASAAALFHATTEPSTGNAFCVTPLGAGLKDGSSWANAAPGQDIHLLLLQCSSGDRIYFAEGDYTTDRVMSLPTGVSLYGGFRAADSYAWSGRNSFTNPTRFTMAAATAFPWATCASANEGQVADGFAIEGYDGTFVVNRNSSRDFQSPFVVRNLHASSGRVEIHGSLEYAWLEDLTECVETRAALHVHMERCGSQQRSGYCLYLHYYTPQSSSLSYCTFVDCNVNNQRIYSYVVNAQSIYVDNCIFENCSGNSVIKLSNMSNCVFVNCAANKAIVWADTSRDMSDSMFVNCSSTDYIILNHTMTNLYNCVFANCTGNDDMVGTEGDTSSSYYKAAACLVVNCYFANRYLFKDLSLVDSIVINTNASSVARYSVHETTIVNSIMTNICNNSYSLNCVVWNCQLANVYYPTNGGAQSEYANTNTLTLGYDNSIARFTNTGFAPARGVQDAGPCPNPVSDPTGYAAWMAAFGDWHPLASSFLVGMGYTITSGIHDDLDGVARPDPPTIGCYEPVPANANA